VEPTRCPECGYEFSGDETHCPFCRAPLPRPKPAPQVLSPPAAPVGATGVDWKSRTTIGGWPLVHIAFGRDAQRKLRVAKGIIAIGQFAIGFITIAQFGVGFLFGFGQFILGATAVAQVAISLAFGAGQIATGYVAIGQFALGYYVLGQLAFGRFIWSTQFQHPEAVEFFRNLARTLRIPGV